MSIIKKNIGLGYALCLFSLLLCACKPGTREVDSSQGKLVIIEKFPSKWVAPRPVRIWLPSGYASSRKYAVLYMQDGQMLFDSSITWNQIAWEVDETVDALMKTNSIRDAIVVGIDNNGLYRNSEYFPEATLPHMPEAIHSRVVHEWLQDKPMSDAYLRFITTELKPYIDSIYSTLSDRSNTFIMGSSMGGLISLYAICLYPDIFGGAGCISTHWPMLNPVSEDEALLHDVPSAFLSILPSMLPDPATHKIYFDHGTLSLDSLYGPYQKQMDALMASKGYDPAHWVTHVFEGTGHSELDWGKRLSIPLEFLLQ